MLSLILRLTVFLAWTSFTNGAQPHVRNQAVLDLYNGRFFGDGTYYGHYSEGATCQFEGSLPQAATDPKVWALAAINGPQFLNSLTCGICLKVNDNGYGPDDSPIGGERIVFVHSYCSDCRAGSLNFALNGDGRWPISIQAVQCPVGDSSIQYAFRGSSPWYLKLQIRNARIPITGAQAYRNKAWVTMYRSQDGFWILNDGKPMPPGAFGVLLTAANGYVLEDSIPRIDNYNILDGIHRVQVPYDPSLPSA